MQMYRMHEEIPGFLSPYMLKHVTVFNMCVCLCTCGMASVLCSIITAALPAQQSSFIKEPTSPDSRPVCVCVHVHVHVSACVCQCMLLCVQLAQIQI